MVLPEPRYYIPAPELMAPKEPRPYAPETWEGVLKRLEAISRIDATVAFHLASFNLPDSKLSFPELVGSLIESLAHEKQLYMAHNAKLLAQQAITDEGKDDQHPG